MASMENMTMQPALALPVRFSIPLATGSLESYIQTVNRFPLLGSEEEQRLATRLRDSGDLDAARDLVLSHLRLVVAVARGFLGYGLPHADLIQEGAIGLIKAVKRFDHARGVRLAPLQAQKNLFYNLRSIRRGESLGAGDVARIAKQLHVAPEDVREMDT